MESTIRRIALIHSGPFSHINDGVLHALRNGFPQATVDLFDTHELPAWDRLRRPLVVLDVLATYGFRGLASGSSVRRFGQRTVRFFDAAKRQLRSALAGSAYDFTLQTQSIVDASQPGIAHFVYTDHTHLANSYYPTFDPRDLYAREWIEREHDVYRNARTTFTMSSHVTRSLVEHYSIPASRIERIGVGSNVPIPEASSLDEARYSSKKILFVGVDWERKGGPQLLEAFKSVLSRHPGARLSIVGCSPEVVHPQVEVLGRVSLSEVARHYRDAAIFCMPTRNEPFGVVFLEAAAYRLPIVASDLGALPDLISNGINGYMVPPDDVGALAARLDQLLSSPELCRVLGRAGYESMVGYFTWARVGERLSTRIRNDLGLASTAASGSSPGEGGSAVSGFHDYGCSRT